MHIYTSVMHGQDAVASLTLCNPDTYAYLHMVRQ